MSETDKVVYLNDHVAYELKMLRHTLGRLATVPPSLDWNAFFDASGVYARNLYDFLTNSRDSKNFKARDFAEFQAKGTSLFFRLNGHVLHLGKCRPSAQDQKIQLHDAQNMGVWIEEQFRVFIDHLPEPYRSKWNWDNADPSKADPLFIAAPSQQSSTSHMTSVSFGSSTLGA